MSDFAKKANPEVDPQSELSEFCLNSKKQQKEQISGSDQNETPSENNPNILNEPIHIPNESCGSSIENLETNGCNGKMNILDMLNEPGEADFQKLNGQKRGSQFQNQLFSQNQTSKKFAGNKELLNKASQDKQKYLDRMRRLRTKDQRETVLKSRAESSDLPELKFHRQSTQNKNLTRNNEINFKKEEEKILANQKLWDKANKNPVGVGFPNSNAANGNHTRPFFRRESQIERGFLGDGRGMGNAMEKKQTGWRNEMGTGGNMRDQMNMFEMKNSYKESQVLCKRPSMADLPKSIYFCEKHKFKKVEFICSFSGCLRELCSMCILEHKEHINSIKHINSHIEERFESLKNLNLKAIKSDINQAEVIHSDRLDSLSQEIMELVNQKFNNLRNNLILANNKARKRLADIKRFKQEYKVLQANPRILEFKNFGSQNNTELIKSCLSYNQMDNEFGVSIERRLFLKQFRQILDNNLLVNSPQTDFNTVGLDCPKFLHWFEWGERNLHLFDIIDYKSRSIKLVNNIKIPNFSRSIVTPTAKIFLLGGEDSEGQPKKEIYMFDLMKLDQEHILEPKALMPHQKYDFTLCHLNGHIYVICGKDTTSEAVNICEK